MAEVNELSPREEMEEKWTWDLTSIFASDDAFETALAQVQQDIGHLRTYEGQLDQSSDHVVEAVKQILDCQRLVEQIYSYAHLKHDQDLTHPKYSEMFSKVQAVAADFSTHTAWFQTEFLSLDEATIQTYLEENEGLKDMAHYFERFIQMKDRLLDQGQEELLAQASTILKSSSQSFSVLNNADMTFSVIKNEDGQAVPLTHGNYSEHMESTNRQVRKEAFHTYLSSYKSLENTFASTLQATVQLHNFMANIRSYDSAQQAALGSHFIDPSVFESLMASVNDHLHLFYDYLKLRKEVLGLDRLHMYDMYVSLVDDSKYKLTYEEAQQVVLKALQPLGEDYLAVVQRAFDERWIDVYENKGKRSGAYSSGTYDTPPYILMNWQDSLTSLYTLVHELGHSVHSYYTWTTQPYIYGDYPIFLAEIASTTNEILLSHYLLSQASSDHEKMLVLNQYLDGFKGTVIRQSQFAEFEDLIHKSQAQGLPLTAHFMNQNYLDLNKKYYGQNIVHDEAIESEWARIPHFYYNYYVYQYATGFCAASSLAQQILAGGSGLDRYLSFLKAGQSDYPLNIMKEAGVDMIQRAYLDQAFQTFESHLNQLKDLIK